MNCSNCGKPIQGKIIEYPSFDWGHTTIYYFDKPCYKKVVLHE